MATNYSSKALNVGARRSRLARLSAVGLIVALIVGCAGKRAFQVVDPAGAPPRLDALSRVRVDSLDFEGQVEPSDGTSMGGMVLGMSEISPAIKGISAQSFEDATLEISILNDRSVRPFYYFGFLPLVGSYMGGTVGFSWKADVSFVLREQDGSTLIEDAFKIKGKSWDEPHGFEYMGTMILGSGVVALGYPNAEEENELGSEISRVAGQEIARRIHVGEAGAYFSSQTQQRDGMSPEAYVAFEKEKARLTKEARELGMVDDQVAQIARPTSSYDLGGGNMLVFGVGVDRYESEFLPARTFAASDCRKIVGWFQRRYELSDERARCVVDEAATAMAVDSFIRREAAGLLGPNDTFVFYFSGHGSVDPSGRSGDGDGLEKYLLVSDSDVDAMPMTSIQLSSLFEAVDRLPARRKIILIDSSFAGPAAKIAMTGLKGLKVSSRTYTNVVEMSGAGTVILAAGKEDQATVEVPELEGGLFSHYLATGLAGDADDNQDQKIDILELHQFLNLEVTARSAGRQTPVFRGSLEQNIEF